MADEELKHYGVKGMRWGVTRASNKLNNATTNKQRDKALKSLSKHKYKSLAEIAKLKKKEKKLDHPIRKNDIRVADLKTKSAKLKNKAGEIDARAELILAKSRKTQAKLDRNKRMQELYQQGIHDIDEAVISRGQKYIAGIA